MDVSDTVSSKGTLVTDIRYYYVMLQDSLSRQVRNILEIKDTEE